MSQTTTRGKHAHHSGRAHLNGLWFEVYECGECNALFAMTAAFVESRKDDGKGWRCPNGHSWFFNGESEEAKLKRRLKQEREYSARLAAERDQVEASLRATKGHLTRQKKRAAAGVCPCCNRTFKQLAAHMQNKHPEYAAGNGEATEALKAAGS